VNIYLKIETTSRDLEPRLLLGLLAAERGHSVFVGPAALVTHPVAAGVLKPGIVHEKSITPSPRRVRELEGYRRFGSICTSQDEESGLLDESYQKFAKMRFSETTINLTAKIFSWGRHDFEGLMRAYPEILNLKEKVICCGSPRVDMWKLAQKGFYLDPSESSTRKDFVLVISNFTEVAGRNRVWQQIHHLRETGYIDNGLDSVDQLSRAGFAHTLTGAFLSGLLRVARENPSTFFVLRPHPEDSVTAWNAILGPVPNIVVDGSGPVGRQMANAKLIMHNGSTTGFEAAVSGKHVIAYRPIPSPYERSVPNKASYEVFSEDELSELVKRVLVGSPLPKKTLLGDDEILSRRFANLLGGFAADRIVEEWERFDRMELSTLNSEMTLRRLTYLYEAKVLGRKFLTRAKRFRQEELRTRGYKLEPMSEQKIRALHQRFVRALGRLNNVRVNVIGRHLICLSQFGEANSAPK
jgi:surface carbohydrate biosynthesis protein